MFDKEKGIYPAGFYLTGRDIPLGGYIAESKGNGCVALYENWKKFREEEEFMYQYFDEDFHISIMEENIVLSVENAILKRL